MITIEQAAGMHLKNHKRKYTAKDGTSFTCVHEDGCYPHLANVVIPFDPDIIIELGTSWGGLTKFFEDHAPKAYIYSFDRPMASRKPDPARFGERVVFRPVDVLKGVAGLKGAAVRVVGLCNLDGRKLLYCDNGNKVREVCLYAPYLKKGDLLGVHDWPREIYYNYRLLKPAARKHVTKQDIQELNKVLEGFTPWCHNEFLQLGLSTRFWIKK